MNGIPLTTPPGHPAAPPRPAPVSRARLFAGLRRRLLRNELRTLLDQSPVRVVSLVLTSLVIWAFVFLLGFAGFRYIAREQKVPAFGAIIAVLLDYQFAALGVMLVFSTALILYSSLFTSAESAFLLATPARADQVFAYKYK